MKPIRAEALLEVVVAAVALIAIGIVILNLPLNAAGADDGVQIDWVAGLLGVVAMLLALSGLLPRRWAQELTGVFRLSGH